MKKFILSITTLAIAGISLAQVGIGTADPDASAILDITPHKVFYLHMWL